MDLHIAVRPHSRADRRQGARCARTGRELAATLKLQSWQVKNHLTWARRFSMAELIAALEGAVDVELALKGSADSQTALLLWITNILRKS